MKKLHAPFFILFLLLFAFQANAQDWQKIDSIKGLLPAVLDTGDTKNLYNLANEYYSFGVHTDSVEDYAQQILEIAELYQHNLSFIRGNFLKGQIAYRKQEIGEAKLYFDKAYELLDTTRYDIWHAIVPNALGVIYMKLEDNEASLRYLQAALKGAEKAGLNRILAPTYSNIAILFGNLEDMDKAFEYFHKSLRAARADNNVISELKTMYSMGAAFSNNRQFDSVEVYAFKCLEKSRELGYEEGILRALRHLSDNFLFTQKYDLAETYAKEVIQSAKGQDAIYHKMPAYRVLASCYAHRGQKEKTQVAVDSVLSMLDRIPAQIYRSNSYEALMDIYRELGDYKTALSYQIRSTAIRDSLYGEDQKAKAMLMQEMYETEKTQRKLLELKIENNKQAFQIKQRTYWLFGLGFLFLLTILVAYLLFQRRMYKTREKISEAEQRLLRLQMNPHFLFNVLSSIQNYLFDKEDTKKAILYLSRFSHLMRQVLEYSRETYIPLEDEIQTLENYLSLQQLRFDHTFDYQIEVGEGIDTWETMIPPLMAQPFVENSIEHGKVHLIEGGKIWIRFEKRDGKIHLTVEDNGVGRAKSKQVDYKENHKSLATHITRDRIEVLSSLSKKKFTFHIIDVPVGGTKVEFGLPIIENV